MEKAKSVKDVPGPMGPEQFLSVAADDDLFRFLRRLPMVAGQPDGRITMSDLVYEMELWPFVKDAWNQVEGSPGIPGRLRQLSSVYKKAEAEFERVSGKLRRQERIIDLPTFVDIYTSEGLP